MQAGTKRVGASLWNVNDSATAALMSEFYKEMFTNKQRPAAAFKQSVAPAQHRRIRVNSQVVIQRRCFAGSAGGPAVGRAYQRP